MPFWRKRFNLTQSKRCSQRFFVSSRYLAPHAENNFFESDATAPHLLLPRPGCGDKSTLLIGEDAQAYTGHDPEFVRLEPQALAHLARFSEPALMGLLLDAALQKNYPFLMDFGQK